jgi:GNAT superfamily N-acetyltransferase
MNGSGMVIQASGGEAGRPPKPGTVLFDQPPPGTFDAIYRALDASSQERIGPSCPRLLVIPLCDDDGAVSGGFWGCTNFQWLRVQMLFVPEPLRGNGVGLGLMVLAEREAQARGCLGAIVDTLSFQAGPFYRKLGYNLFGVLEDCPPGYSQLYFWKRLIPPA